MGKGSRNGRSRYRIVVHSAKYMKQKKLRERQKAIRDGDIFFDGEAELELKVELSPLGNMPIVLAIQKKKEPDGVKC